jgi:hypothetical protein
MAIKVYERRSALFLNRKAQIGNVADETELQEGIEAVARAIADAPDDYDHGCDYEECSDSSCCAVNNQQNSTLDNDIDWEFYPYQFREPPRDFEAFKMAYRAAKSEREKANRLRGEAWIQLMLSLGNSRTSQ